MCSLRAIFPHLLVVCIVDLNLLNNALSLRPVVLQLIFTLPVDRVCKVNLSPSRLAILHQATSSPEASVSPY